MADDDDAAGGDRVESMSEEMSGLTARLVAMTAGDDVVDEDESDDDGPGSESD